MSKKTNKTTKPAAPAANTAAAETKAAPAAKTAAKAPSPKDTPAEFDAIWKLVWETSKTYEKPSPDYFLAVQINLTGEKGGTFFIAMREGRIDVEPYDYKDRSCGLTLSPEDFLLLMNDELDAVQAYFKGRLKVDGNVDKALEFAKVLKKGKK